MKALATFIILTTISLNTMAQQKVIQTAGRTQLGEFAPEFAHLNDDDKTAFQREMIFLIGEPAQEILPGTVIHIPANVKHWHGAAKDSWFAHLAFEIPGKNASNEWLEAVSDEEYSRLK